MPGHPARRDRPRHEALRLRPYVPVRLIGRLVVVLLLDAVALLVLAWILPGFTIDDPWSALALAAALGVANAVVWPLLIRFALPFTVLTLGLGALVVNGAVLLVITEILGSVHVAGLFEAVVVVLGLSLLTMLFGGVLALDRGDLWYRHVVRRQLKRSQLASHTRHARIRVPGDRRAGRGRAAPRAARRQRAVPRPLGARRRLQAARLGDALVLADRRLPGGAAARRRPRHARVPLVGEGPRPRDRHQPPEGRGRDRTPALERARAAAR